MGGIYCLPKFVFVVIVIAAFGNGVVLSCPARCTSPLCVPVHKSISLVCAIERQHRITGLLLIVQFIIH